MYLVRLTELSGDGSDRYGEIVKDGGRFRGLALDWDGRCSNAKGEEREGSDLGEREHCVGWREKVGESARGCRAQRSVAVR